MSKRKNARYLRAKQEIRRMKVNIKHLVRLTQEQRGRTSEEIASQMIQELLEEGKVLGVAQVERYSWMDSVLRIDKIIIRISGKPIPCQFKSSHVSSVKFKNKFGNFFTKRFGAMPVVTDFPPGMTNWVEKKKKFEKSINNWSGRFKFEEWQLRYSTFFDHKNFPQFGSHRNRIRIFLRHRKELIQNQTPQLM